MNHHTRMKAYATAGFTLSAIGLLLLITNPTLGFLVAIASLVAFNRAGHHLDAHRHQHDDDLSSGRQEESQ